MLVHCWDLSAVRVGLYITTQFQAVSIMATDKSCERAKQFMYTGRSSWNIMRRSYIVARQFEQA